MLSTPHIGRATPAAGPLGSAIERAVKALGRLQRGGDHWTGVLSSSALATAMSMAALHLVDPVRHRDAIGRGRDWLFATQTADGGWGDAVVDAANVNATSLALAAITLSRPDFRPEPETKAALTRVHACLQYRFGGFDAVGDPARCTLSGPCRTVAALAGLMDWRRIKRLRPEVVLLPRAVRRTISTTFPAYLSLATLHAQRVPGPLNRLPTYPLAVRRAGAWLRRVQGPDGSFEESAFLTSVVVASHVAAGQPAQAPWLQSAVRFVLASQRADGSWPIDRDLETFDTDLAVLAYRSTGLTVPGEERVRGWLLARQCQTPCFATSAPSGGWSWAMPAGWPDSDDTAYTLLALSQLGVERADPALGRGADWLRGLQARNGSWSTFVTGSRMPFDHDCPYVTGHALSGLQAAGWLSDRPEVRTRALAYLKAVQQPDGSFRSIWFREATMGTAAVVEALADLGHADLALAGRARAALLRAQHLDGGWGGRRGEESTAEETGCAVMALLRSPEMLPSPDPVARGLAWLVDHQQADGTWVPTPIGLYYSAMWYSDSMYALSFPLQALGRAQRLHV